MSATWGRQVRVTIFGESHGTCVGGVVDGLPPGKVFPKALVDRELRRRRPGGPLATPRKETDAYEILSGLYEGKTTGAPLCVVFRNKDVRSGDYEALKHTPRPSHADYVSWVKYKGFGDPRGGGRFSGRLTAFLVFAGALAKALLKERFGIEIGSHLMQVGGVADEAFGTGTEPERLALLGEDSFPMCDPRARRQAMDLLEAVGSRGDSIGAVVEAMAVGVPAGWGEPFFDSVESRLAGLVFSIPGVKGLEFGLGFGFSEKKGSEANDAFCFNEGAVATETNHSGGINGGITNGMPLVFRAAFRPTPSIGLPQRTVDLSAGVPAEIVIEGRHDPCIALRALPVVEAALALSLLDLSVEGDA